MADQIVLAERLDTAGAVALAAKLLKLPPDATVTLDGHAVAHLGAQAVQVILSAAKTANAAGGALICERFSDRATEHLAAVGLSVAQLSEVPQ